MKVLIVNKFYYNRGGDCICAMNTERILREAGHETAVYSMRYSDNFSTVWSDYFAPEVSFSGGIGSKLKAALRVFGLDGIKRSFAKILHDFRPDVVHFNNIHSYLSPAIVEMAKKSGAKTVWTLHDCKLFCPAYLCLCGKKICDSCIGGNKFDVVRKRCMKGGLPGNVIGWLEAEYWNRKKLERFTDAFICPSRFMAKKMEADGFCKEKLHVVHNSVSSEFVENTSVLKDKEPYYLYVGRLSEEKGVATLLSAAAELPYKLKLAGGGPLTDEFKAKYGNCDNIEFLGHLKPVDVKKAVAKAKFTVMPSECYENNPLSVMESLCSGTPVVGAEIGGIPELINFGNGFLFRSGDKESLSRTIKTAWNADFDYAEISSGALPLFSEQRYLNDIMGIYNK